MNESGSNNADDDALEATLRQALSARHRKDAPRILTEALAAPLAELPAGPRGAALRRIARELYHPCREGVVAMVLRAVGRRLEVLSVVGEQLQPVPVRGTSGSEGVLVRHHFGGREVTAHVSVTPAPGFVVTLDLWGGTSGAADWRVSLCRGDRELASEIPRHGRVLFPEVEAGRYRVVLSGPGGRVGELDLTFEDAAA